MRRKKRQKCIDITLRKWPWVKVGKKSYIRFRPPGELFEGFGIFPHLSICLGCVENPQIHSYLAKFGCGNGCRCNFLRIFSSKKSGKIHRNFLNFKKIEYFYNFFNIFSEKKSISLNPMTLDLTSFTGLRKGVN